MDYSITTHDHYTAAFSGISVHRHQTRHQPRAAPAAVSDRDPKSYRGVDRDQQVVDIISKLTSEKATIPASCVQRDAADTGLESNSADVVIGEAVLTMQTERGKQAIIGEAFRLLRAGGTYSIHELGL